MVKRQDSRAAREQAIKTLIEGVRNGRSVVPLVGAGISIEAGVPPLSEVTRYLAKTKAYLRHRVFTSLFPQPSPASSIADLLDGRKALPPHRGMPPRDFLREFGWPDPHELNSSLWHWLWSDPKLRDFTDSLDLLVNSEIVDSLERIDQRLAENFRELMRAIQDKRERAKRRLRGSYWKILLTQLTRSSPDLVDTMFQRLTRDRDPATAHRYFAFLTPVLRLRLFLTINFDTLLEDALRLEGFRPTVYEVAEGLSLPHPKLVQEGLSVVKLHGGAYGLLVGDKLDSPLDEETRKRFLSYLPEHLILLVMGIGGWDQRVLDMVELARERHGDVLWLYFEPQAPPPLKERFVEAGQDSSWLQTVPVHDPGAFLREVYGTFKRFHPSTSLPIQVSDLRPALLDQPFDGGAGHVLQGFGGRLVIYEDDRNDFGLGSALRLARFVAEKAKTHQPVWVDLETKFTVEDVLVEMIQQLRRYDPGLPPEILVMESAATSSGAPQKLDFRKVVRRLYAALARGRYILAFNGVRSFGRRPTRHHAYEDPGERSVQEAEAFRQLWEELLDGIEPASRGREEQPESLGLLDSILAFAVDWPIQNQSGVANLFNGRGEKAVRGDEGWVEGAPFRRQGDFEALKKNLWTEHPVLVLLTAMRRRRSLVALYRLMPKYLRFQGSTANPSPKEVEQKLRALEKEGYLFRLEGGDYWMSRKLRNKIYDQIRSAAEPGNPLPLRIRSLAILAFVHQDIAEYHHRDLYVGSQEVSSLLEELYHRISSLRHLRSLEVVAKLKPSVDGELADWLEALTRSVSRIQPGVEPIEDPWIGSPKITVKGRLVEQALVQRRLRGLRVLREVLEQEQEALLSRVPSATLKGWLDEIRKDLDHIASGAPELRIGLENLLEDIQIEVLQDRMKALEIVKLRRDGLLRLAGGGLPAMESGGDPELIWPSLDGKDERSPTLDQLRRLCRGNRAGERPGPELWERRYRVGRALADVARALKRSPWEHPGEDLAGAFEGALKKLVDEEWRLSMLASDIWQERIPPRHPVLKTIHLRLQADQVLWGQSPWETKGKDHAALEEQRKAAHAALRASETALKILDGIREESRTERSYLYSLKGRALYLLSSSIEDFDRAYREFDLARAGLSEATASEREALAVALLRQAECLMVHSDDSLASWVVDLVRLKVRPGAAHWRPLLSVAGTMRLSLVETGNKRSYDKIQSLLRLSLANSSPDVLKVLELCAWANESTRIELSDTLGTMRTRLATARDLLIRTEALLEHSRRKIEWWACLFQLRSQLAVERLLLLISGDLPLGAAVAAPKLASGGELAKRQEHNEEECWKDVQSWLKQGGPQKRARLRNRERLRSNRRDVLREDPERRRFFIHRFQGLLRQGLMAVRQGLDILLPDYLERRKDDRLETDVLLNRLLRTWTELMVCGVYATNMSIDSEPSQDDKQEQKNQKEENEKRWGQWHHLNWLSGLVILPRCKEIESWFVAQNWSEIDPPSLAARAVVLARMDLCLAGKEDSSQMGSPVGAGGNAIEWLHRTLKDVPAPE